MKRADLTSLSGKWAGVLSLRIHGVAAALVAVAPVVYARGGALPWAALVWLVPVAVAGLLSATLATRRVRRLPLVPSLRRE